MNFDGKVGTVLVENPSGNVLFTCVQELQQVTSAVFQTAKQLSTASESLKPVSASSGVEALHGQTLYLL